MPITYGKTGQTLIMFSKQVPPIHTVRNREAFVLGMHNIASLKAKDIIKLINLKGVKTALDLGGGPGTYSIEMSKRGVHVTLFDLPETIEIAQEIMRKASGTPVHTLSGDFMVDDIGKGYDLIFISQIFHAYSEQDNMYLVKKCRKALNEGGRIVVQEFPISTNRVHPPQSALFSINMLVNTEGGRCYSSDEIKSWLQKVGLKDIKEQTFDDTVIISGVYSR